MKLFSRIAASVVIAIFVAVPMFAARGSADFTRYVAIGDSYGAGVESASLNERHQPFSWPAVIARQAHATDFVQPLVSFPGIGNELQLVNVVSFPPVITPAPGTGQPINVTFPRPFNNLSVPGANVTDVITLKGSALSSPPRTPELFAQFILRGLGTQVEQAIGQRPTFITIWIGGNDVLGAVLAGTPAALTSVDTFRTSYNAMLDALTANAPAAGIVVGNLPTAAGALPIINTLAPVIINPATRQPLLVNGAPVPLFGIIDGGAPGLLPAGSKVLLTAAGDLSTGFGIPPTLATVPPFNQLPNAGKPLADRHFLTPTELTAIGDRVTAFNTIINDAARAKDIPVADIKGLFDRVASGQLFVGPLLLTNSFITGGFFSLDGFHLTDMGYTMFANEFIKTINASYNTRIPLGSIAALLDNNGAFFKVFDGLVSGSPYMEWMGWNMSEEAIKQIQSYATQPAPKRRMRIGEH